MANDTSSPSPHLQVKGVPVTARGVAAVLLTAIAIWFIAVNSGSVTIRLWVSSVSAPLWLVLAITLLVGVTIGWLVGHRQHRAAARR